MAGSASRLTAHEELQAAGGAAGVHTKGEWQAAALGSTGDQGQGGADGCPVDSGTDFRIGFSGLLVRFLSGTQRR